MIAPRGFFAAAAALTLALGACGQAAGSAPSSASAASSSRGAATSAAAASSAQPARMNVSYTTQTPASSAAMIAAGAGLFGKHGLDLSLQYLGPTSLTAALISGELDAGYGSAGSAAAADAHGSDLVIVGATYEGPLFSIAARGDIQGVKDLKGKRVAVTQRGSTPDLLVQELVRQQGLSPSDVTMVYIPEPNAQIAAMSAGAVDAVIAAEPTISISVSQGAHIIWEPSQGSNASGAISMSVILVKRSYIPPHRDTLKRFLMANMDAIKLMRTNPDEAAKYDQAYLKIDDEKVLRSSVQSIAKISREDLRFSLNNLQAILDTTATTDPDVAKVKPQDIVDFSLLDDIKAAAGA